MESALYSSKTSISVIIPALNEESSLPRLLDVLCALDLHQIIVVDAHSTDNTPAIARTYPHVTLIQSSACRGAQINQGISLATGDIIWILHADSQVPANAVTEIHRIMSKKSVALGCFSLTFDKSHPLLSVYSFFSRFDSVFTTFGDQGYFLRRHDVQLHKPCPSWPLLEDVALRQQIKRFGRIEKSRATITTSARRFIKLGMLRTQLFNLYILGQYLCGADVKRLAMLYKNTPSQASTIDATPVHSTHIAQHHPQKKLAGL